MTTIKAFSVDKCKYVVILVGFISSILFTSESFGQEIQDQGVVTYSYRNNGKVRENASLKMLYKNGIVAYESSRQRRGSQREREFLDFTKNLTYQVLTTDDSKFIVEKSFSEYDKVDLLDETEDILGYTCKKAVVKIKSNTIEVWYTNDLTLKGTPRISVTPGLGLILKMVRNKDYEVFASNIEFRAVKDEELNFNINDGQMVDAETYLRQVIDSRYQTISVFEKVHLNFGDEIVNPDSDKLDVTYRYSKGTVALKKVSLPEIKSGMRVFAELETRSNGDAYDRSGSLFIIPVQEKKSFLDAFRNGIDSVPVYRDKHGKGFQGIALADDYEPPLELMRFFTPFGVGHFNEKVKIKGYDWAESAMYRQDITELLPSGTKDIWIGTFIGNYAKGGHYVDLNLKFYPSFGQGEGKKTWIKSLFNTMNIMEMSGQNYGTMFHEDSLTVTVTIPEGLETLTLRYTSTGHGGWGGGDEFNPKLNEIFVDGERVYAFIPWRTDCATYRLLNPASGNFGNGLSSSDLSRSNWCPGTLTVPEDIILNDLSPGPHTFKIAIPIGEKEGGSFSAWNVSGTLIGVYK